MPRVPYPERPEIETKLAEYLDRLAPLNVNRMLGHGAAAGLAWARMGVALINKGRLSEQLRELAILRVGHLSASAYELHQHTSFARLVGVAEDKIEGARVGPDSPAFNETERALIAYVDDVFKHVRASDETFAGVSQRLSKGEVLELTILVGYYMTTARILGTFEIECEPEGSLGAYMSADR